MANFGESVVYQIYPKSFKDTNGDGIGDLPGIISKLNYLQDLGVEYIWITPFFKSPQRDNGYDVSDYCSVDPMFGTMDNFDLLVKEAEKRNMGVMLDMVFNHTSVEHEWFKKALAGDKKYQDYYIFKEGTPDKIPTNWESAFGGPTWEYVESLGKWYFHIFDVSQADLNWENPEVREELKKVILFWKNKGVKGFRFDAINMISKPEVYEDAPAGEEMNIYTNGPRIHEYLKEIVKDTGIEDMITVGEVAFASMEDCIKYSNPDEKEFSMVFSFDHLVSDFPNGEKWALGKRNNALLKKIFEERQIALRENNGWDALYWCNHDQPRIVSRLGDESIYWRHSAKMLATCIHLMRGTPYIYQGEEIGMTNAHFDDISEYRDVESLNYYKIMLEQGKTERQALDILGQRSRDNSRTPMQWTDGDNAGFTTGTPWINIPKNYKYINTERGLSDEQSILNYYKKLIQFRKDNEVISKGRIVFIEQDNDKVLAYRRCTDMEVMYVYNNLTDDDASIVLPGGDFEKIFGNYPEQLSSVAGRVRLRPYESIVLH